MSPRERRDWRGTTHGRRSSPSGPNLGEAAGWLSKWLDVDVTDSPETCSQQHRGGRGWGRHASCGNSTPERLDGYRSDDDQLERLFCDEGVAVDAPARTPAVPHADEPGAGCDPRQVRRSHVVGDAPDDHGMTVHAGSVGRDEPSGRE